MSKTYVCFWAAGVYSALALGYVHIPCGKLILYLKSTSHDDLLLVNNHGYRCFVGIVDV